MKHVIPSVTAYAFLFILLSSCNQGKSDSRRAAMFTLLEKGTTKIDFINTLNHDEEFNTYTYRNFYNGAGVGLGDFNNDGLTDIYFCSNQAGNRLYLNKGAFIFEDITHSAGVSCSGSWSTGCHGLPASKVSNIYLAHQSRNPSRSSSPVLII